MKDKELRQALIDMDLLDVDVNMVRVIYDGGINQELDARVKKALTTIGLKWLGDGIDTSTGERDISFTREYAVKMKKQRKSLK